MAEIEFPCQLSLMKARCRDYQGVMHQTDSNERLPDGHMGERTGGWKHLAHTHRAAQKVTCKVRKSPRQRKSVKGVVLQSQSKNRSAIPAAARQSETNLMITNNYFPTVHLFLPLIC